MKKISLLAITALLAANVFAGDHTLNLVSRDQWKYADNKPTASGIKSYSDFRINYLKLKGGGKLNEQTTYNFAFNVLSANATKDTTNNSSDFVDMAFMTVTLIPGTSFQIGKVGVLVGGREFDYSVADLYSYSAFANATPGGEVGLTFSQDFMGQNFQAQVINGNKDRGTGSEAQTRMGWAVIYYGDLMTGMIKPIIGYTLLPAVTSHNDSGFLSAGLQFNLAAPVTFEADYSLLTVKNGISTNTDRKTTSLVGLVRYNGEKFKPFARFISDKVNYTTSIDSKRIAYDVGVEYQASKEDAVRYHAVFSGGTVESAVGDTSAFGGNGKGTKYSPISIALGVKFNAAILK